MPRTAETTSLTRELSIAASPETVWEFLVDPDKMVRWMGIAATIEPRAGGAYRCDVIPGHTASGEVVEVDRPRRLVFTFGWEPDEEGTTFVPPGSSMIEFELEPQGSGTRLTFTHRDLPSAEETHKHEHGWDHYLARLDAAAGGGDPGADPWVSGGM
jgi:uncharacterized protein YndB with AHSA1/START domain